MFLEKAFDEMTKKNKVVVGFDLGDEHAQISLCRMEQSMPDTISRIAGAEEYNIPVTFCKDPLSEEEVEAFLRKCMTLIASYARIEDIICIVFSLREMNTELTKLIGRVMKRYDACHAEITFMSHEDCFYQYMIHQPEEMWIHDVLLYEYQPDGIYSFFMSMNRNTRPVVAFMESEHFPQMRMTDVAGMKAEQKAAFFRQLDDAFLEIVRGHCEDRNVTSVFLLGDVFSKEWCKDSLRFLCKNRRVFQGNNLFSKGACYGAREKVMASTLSRDYVYLSGEKLKANIGIECNRGKEKAYQPLLDAGTNWFEARKEIDFILARDNRLPLTVTFLESGRPKIAEITLEGLQVRGNRTNRIGLTVYMENVDMVVIEVADKGFGEFFPSTGKVWRESFSLDQICGNS